MEASDNNENLQNRLKLGKRLKQIRLDNQWTLKDVAERCGLAVSTISKAERGKISLTYDRLTRLANSLNLYMADLFMDENSLNSVTGHSVNRVGIAHRNETDNYIYDMLSIDFQNKAMVPILGRVKARTMQDFDAPINHPGEEFLYLLTGELTVCLVEKDPIILQPGDSIYLDSTHGHIYLSSSEQDATFVVVCCNPAKFRENISG